MLIFFYNANGLTMNNNKKNILFTLLKEDLDTRPSMLLTTGYTNSRFIQKEGIKANKV